MWDRQGLTQVSTVIEAAIRHQNEASDRIVQG
jgi:hypothetical protein